MQNRSAPRFMFLKVRHFKIFGFQRKNSKSTAALPRESHPQYHRAIGMIIAPAEIQSSVVFFLDEHFPFFVPVTKYIHSKLSSQFPLRKFFQKLLHFFHKTYWQILKSVVYCRHKEQGSDSSEDLEHDSSASESVGRFESLMYAILHLFSATVLSCCTSNGWFENRY